MNCARPEFLWLLTLFPLLVLWAIRGRLRRRRCWEALAQRGRAPREGTWWWLGSVACLILALAQPRWGRLAGISPPGHDAILLIDVSRSMGAEDAVPNRLGMAVEAAESLVRALAEQPANRAAVVAFAGRGVLRCPLTENLGAVLEALHRLRPGTVQPGGTDLGAGLDAALEAIDPQEHAQGPAIVLFSDGEDLADRWRPRLDRLRQQEVMVHAVALGDAEQGHPVPSGAGDQPVRYQGKPVLSRRSDAALEAIARQTGGAVIPLGLSSGDLGVLYRTRIEPAARRRRETTRLADQTERFPLLLFAASTLLLAGCWPPGRGGSWPWRGIAMGRGIGSWRRPAKRLARASLVLAAAATVTGAGQSPSPSPSATPQDRPTGRATAPDGAAVPGGASPSCAESESESAAEAVARGRAAYRNGQLDQALEDFEAAIRREPAAPVPRYNAAAALFQLGRYEEARRRYLEARAAADGSLRTKIDYALGNTALLQGDIPGAITAYDACIASTANGSELDAVRQYARENRRFALEQAEALAVPQGQGSDDPPQSPRPNGRRPPNRQPTRAGSSTEDQPEAGGSSPDEAENSAGRDRPPGRRRRLGGAGGSRSTPPGTAGDTPEDRLDAALEHIRAAQSRRLPDDPPPDPVKQDRRDW